MKTILAFIFGILCFIQLLIIIVVCIRSRIIDKENQEMESEI